MCFVLDDYERGKCLSLAPVEVEILFVNFVKVYKKIATENGNNAGKNA